jgi:hypothetical protein
MAGPDPVGIGLRATGLLVPDPFELARRVPAVLGRGLPCLVWFRLAGLVPAPKYIQQ